MQKLLSTICLYIYIHTICFSEDSLGRKIEDPSLGKATEAQEDFCLPKEFKVSLLNFTPNPFEKLAVHREKAFRDFGVQFDFAKRELHGPVVGPDGKLYFSVGDRGASVEYSNEGNTSIPETGSIFRCKADGTQFEIMATGLRNPGDLAFDDFGNLFTTVSQSDNDHPAYLVYVVEGSDSGWRRGYSYLQSEENSIFTNEGDRYQPFENQSPNILPPVCIIENRPTGLAYYPGTSLGSEYNGKFFISHFNRSLKDSGIDTYTIKTKGAGFELIGSKNFLQEVSPMDITFGPDNRLYFSEWVSGSPTSDPGRIYTIELKDPDRSIQKIAEGTTQLISKGMTNRPSDELAGLLSHTDQRVRFAAQFELTDRGEPSLPVFEKIAENIKNPRLARLHALWGMGQLADSLPDALNSLSRFLNDADSEVRAQSAKLIGDHFRFENFSSLLIAIKDPNPRVVFFAAQSLGKLNRKQAIPALINLLRSNDDHDPFIRNAVVIALARLGLDPALENTVNDPSQAVKLGGLAAYRRLEDPSIALYLEDFDPVVVSEAARAINDVPIEEAIPALAALLTFAPLDDIPLVLRTINAHFRLGTPANAQALADFASLPYVPASLRAEAIKQVGMWANPPTRDRLTGAYLPLPPRDPAPAREALREFLANNSGKVPEQVQVATIKAVGELKIPGTGHALWDVVYQGIHSTATRIAALQALEKMDDLRLEVAADTAAKSKDAALRETAIHIMARRDPEVFLPTFKLIARKGTDVEQRLVFSYLSGIAHPLADEILIQALERLASGDIAVEAQEKLLDAAMASSNSKVKALAIEIQDEWSSGADRIAQ